MNAMNAVRIISCSERPFDVSKLVYLHCIDLQTKKYTPVTSFPCLEILSVFGHFSFPNELAVRRVCCVLWNDEMEARLSDVISPVLLKVKSSCYFTVIIFFAFLVVKMLSFERLLGIDWCTFFMYCPIRPSIHEYKLTCIKQTQLLY